MMRVQVLPVIFAFAGLAGCATRVVTGPAVAPVTASARVSGPLTYSIVSLASGQAAIAKHSGFIQATNSFNEDAKMLSLLSAFDHCAISGKSAVVTPLKIIGGEVAAPFECFTEKHGVAVTVRLSEDAAPVLVQPYMHDLKGAVLAREVEDNITGLKNGDVIVAIGDRRVANRTELARAVDQLPIGPTKYSVVRANHVIQVTGDITDRTLVYRETAAVLLAQLCRELRGKTTSRVCAESVARQ